MALKIRLRQMGRTNRLTYRLVVTDARAPRDGKYIENLGHYNPHAKENHDVSVIEDRVQFWLDQGAELSEKAESLVARAAPGVMKALREKKMAKKLKKIAKKSKESKAPKVAKEKKKK